MSAMEKRRYSGMTLPPLLLVVFASCFLGSSSQEDVQYVAAYTPGTDEAYSRAWVTAPNKVFQFRVKASQNAHIILAIEPYKATVGTRVEVKIGTNTNKKSSLQLNLATTSPLITADTANYLDENEARDFWIQWSDSKVLVGRGNDSSDADSVFLNSGDYGSNELDSIFSMGFDTRDVEGVWEFPKDSTPNTYLTTRDSDPHGYMWFPEYHADHIIFSLQTVAPNTGFVGRVLLCPEYQNLEGGCYLVQLGNTVTTIERFEDNEPIDSSDSPDLVSDLESRFFWVSWTEGLIAVGRGHKEGYQVIASGRVESGDRADFKAASIYGGAASGTKWEFRVINDNTYLFQTSATTSRTENNWLMVAGRHSFIFEVRASSDVILVLKNNEQKENNVGDYIIALHKDTTTESYIEIWDPEGTTNTKSPSLTEPLLSSQDFVPFWLSWSTGLVQLGTGNEPLKEGTEKLSMVDPHYTTASPRIIRTLVLDDKDGKSDIQWQFATDAASSVISYTAAPEVNWLVVLDVQTVVFSVKAGGELLIQLCSYLGNRQLNTYNIGIASEGATIVKNFANKAEAQAEDLFSDADLTYLWLSWHGGVLTLGRGSISGENPVVVLDDSRSEPYEINAMAFTSMDGQAEWHFGETEVPNYRIQTNDMSYLAAWMDDPQALFTFSVLARAPVSLALTRTPGVFDEDTGYTIDLSGETSVLYEKATGRNDTKDSSFKINGKSLTFWVSWFNSSVRVGVGEPFLDEFLRLDDVDGGADSLKQITGVSMASTPHETPALWTVSKLIGKMLGLSPKDVVTPVTLTTDNDFSMAFRARAASSVMVDLTSTLTQSASSTRFQVVLGEGANNLVLIRNMTTGDTTSIDYMGILSPTEFRWFWISWYSGLIQVGTGNIVGNNRVIYRQENLILPFHFAQVSCGDTCDLEFSLIEDKKFTIASAPGVDRHTIMRTSRPYFQFKLRACQNAVVQLLSSTEPVEVAYEFTFGADSDTRLTIRDSRYEELEANELVTDTLSCTMMRRFWLSWEGGEIAVGRGELPGYTIYKLIQQNPQPVVGISLYNADLEHQLANALWEFSETAVSNLKVVTEAPRNFRQFWVTVQHQSELNFRLRSRGDAWIALSRIPEVTTSDTYFISLGGGPDHDQFEVSYGTQSLGKIPMSGMMDPDHFRLWRVSWEVGTIQIYRGRTLVLSVEYESSFEISSVAVASDGDVDDATTWELDNLQGNAFLVQTTAGDIGNHTWVSKRVSAVMHREFQFGVLTDQQITLQLVNRVEAREEGVFELVIGKPIENGKYLTYIRDISLDGVFNELANYTHDQNPLSGVEGNSFWVSWQDTLKVGRENLYTNFLLNTTEIDVQINILALSSLGTATWSFSKDTADSVYVTSLFPPDVPATFTRAWENIGGESHTVVNVRARSDVSFVMATTAFITNVLAYRIDIRHDGYVGITDVQDESSVVEDTITREVLHDSEFRSFWFRWNSLSIEFGTGPVVGQETLLVFPDIPTKTLHTINALGISATDADWYFLQTWPNTYSIGTVGVTNFRTHWFVVKEPIFSFRLQACSDAIILLEMDEPEVGDYTLYEVVIGGMSNQKSFVRRRFQEFSVTEEDTPNILSCDEMRQFWVSYDSGFLEFGSGDVHTHNILSWTLEGMSPLQRISIATNDGIGLWEVAQDQEAETYQYDHVGEDTLKPVLSWVNVIGKQSFKFLVRSCEDARLVLAATPGQYGTLTKELRIGIDNQRTAIYDQFESPNDPIHSATTYLVIDCNTLREFWLTWDGSGVTLGTGPDVGEDGIFYYTALYPHMHPINAIGMYSPADVDSTWKVGNFTEEPKPIVLRDEYFTLFTYGPDDSARRIFNTMSSGLTFSVKAAQEAVIYLTAKPGIFNTEGYIITLGALDNTQVTIQDIDNPSFHKNVSDAFDPVLVLNEQKNFWISWDLFTVSVGKGNTTGESVMVSLHILGGQVYTNIHSVALSTGVEHDEKGEWRFFKDIGRYFNFTTVPSESFDYKELWFTTYMDDFIVFQVKACSDAYVLLSDVYRQIDNVYEVMIGGGGNTISGIRSKVQGVFVETETTPDILSCNETRYFWVRWGQGAEFGEGRSVGVNIIAQITDHIGKDIRHVSFATGAGQTGEWHMHNSEEDTFTVRTIGDNTYDHMWVYPSGEHYEFEVTGCEGALLLLAEEPLAPEKRALELIIGDDLNRRLIIRDVNSEQGTTMILDQDIQHLLNCHASRRFWITWYENTLHFGKGQLLTTRNLLDLTVAVPFTIRAVSLSAVSVMTLAGLPNMLTWDYEKDQARSNVFSTKTVDHDRLPGIPLHWLNTYGTHSAKFKVKGCDYITIHLCRYFGLTDYHSYELRIDHDNETSLVDVNGQPMDSTTASYLHPDYAKWFWVSWPGDSIYVGQGPVIDDRVALSWTDMTERHVIEAIGFESQGTCTASWEFTELPDRLFEVMTYVGGNHRAAWIYMHRKYFAFSIKACSNASIAIADVAGVLDTNAYEIILDGEDGRSSIVDANKTVLFTNATGTNVLNCNAYKKFWVSWLTDETQAREIAVGQGELFTGKFLSFKDATPFGAHVLSLDTPQGDGHWLFRDDSGMTTEFFTQDFETYERNVYRVAAMDNVVFWVQAASNANIYLFDNYHTAYMYEVVLGAADGMEVQIIRERKPEPVKKTTFEEPVITDAALQPFWLSWHEGRLTMGRGVLAGKDQFIDYLNETSPLSVSYLSFSTTGGATGLWQFYNITDDTFLISNVAEMTTGDIWFTFSPDQSMYQFSVRACQDAILQLVSGGQNSQTLFNIILGSNENLETALYRQGELVKTVHSPEVLNCYEDRWFILKWWHGQLELLVASESGRQLLYYVDDMFLTEEIHGLTLHTEYGIYGEWALPRGPGKALRIHNGRSYADPYCCLWLTVLERKYVVFSVQAIRDASLVLAEVPGVTTGRVYEIVIGANYNNMTYIRDGLSSEPAVINVGEHLDGSEFRTFFVSWENDVITIGDGPIPAAGNFLAYQAPSPFPIRGLAVATKDWHDITWEFSQIAGNQFLTQTDTVLNYNQVQIIPRDRKLVFGVKAATDVRLALSDTPGEHTVKTYEIIIGGDNNTILNIRDVEKDEGYPIEAIDILHADKVRYFWVTWDDMAIAVGDGKIAGDPATQRHSYMGFHLRNVTAIALSTKDAVGVWEWDVNQDKMVSFDNPTKARQINWLTVVGYNAMVFRVKACETIKVILAATQGNSKVSATNITLTNNGMSYLENPMNDNPIVDQLYTEDILNCNDYRAFWLQWSFSFLHVGTGAEIGHNRFLKYEDSNLHYVSAVAMVNEFTDSGWEILSLEGNYYTAYTPGDGLLEFAEVTPGPRDDFPGKYVMFSVKAARDAVMALLPSEYSMVHGSPHYEVVIGANGNQEIHIVKVYSDGTRLEMNKETQPSVLDAAVLRNFWVAWSDDGLLMAGSGKMPGRFENIRVLDSNRVVIERASITTTNDVQGEWKLPQTPGDTVKYFSQKAYSYNTTFISVLDRNHVIFHVAACQGAHVALSDVPDNVMVHTYEVVIGAHDNKMVEVRKGIEGEVVAQVPKNDLVLCNTYHTFWISWDVNLLAIGQGGVVNTDTLLQYTAFPLKSVNTVSLASFRGNRAWWKFDYVLPDLALGTTTPIPSTTTTPTTKAHVTTKAPPVLETTAAEPHTRVPGTEGTPEKSTGGLSQGTQTGIAFGVILVLVVVAILGFLAYKYFFVGNKADTHLAHFENPTYQSDGDATFDAKVFFEASPNGTH